MIRGLVTYLSSRVICVFVTVCSVFRCNRVNLDDTVISQDGGDTGGMQSLTSRNGTWS